MSDIHFSGESASLLVEKRQNGSEPNAPDHDANERGVKDEGSRQLKSNHVSLLERNERQFYDNLLVSRNDSLLLIDNPRAFLASVLPISAHYYVARRNKQNAQHQSTVPIPRTFHRKATLIRAYVVEVCYKKMCNSMDVWMPRFNPVHFPTRPNLH